MKALTFQFSAAPSQISWVADADYTFVGAYLSTNTGVAAISTDPTMVMTDLTAPPTAKLNWDVIWIAATRTTAAVSNIKIPIIKGKTYYAIINLSSGSVIAYLDEVIPAE